MFLSKKNYYTLFFAVAILLAGSCTKDACQEATENDNPAQNNALMQNEHIYGKSNLKSNLYGIIPNADAQGSFYVQGFIDEGANVVDVVVGGTSTQTNGYFEQLILKMSATGDIISEKRPGFPVTGKIKLPQGSYLQSDYLLVGGNATTGGSGNVGRLLLYDANGSLKINFSTNENVGFNSFIIKQQTSVSLDLLMSGWIVTNGVNYPVLMTCSILQNNTIANFQVIKTFSNYPNTRGSLGDLGGNYLLSCEVTGSNQKQFVYLDNNFDEIWHKTYQYRNEITYLQDFAVNGNDLLFCGYAYGAKLASGLIVCIDKTNGNVKWERKYVLSTNNDSFLKCYMIDGKLVLVGQHSGFVTSLHYSNLGNGALVVVNPINGNIEHTYTFGDAKKASNIKSIVPIGTKLHIFGSTNISYGFKSYQSWFFTLDKSSIIY